MTIMPEFDVPLAPRTTLQLGGSARAFVAARTEADVLEALAWAESERVPVAVLGGGSNVVVPDEGFAGLVVQMATRGIDVAQDGSHVEVTVAAGEPWDELVARTVDEGWAGIECLSGIPGLAGATPIQNVGAYGQEVAQVITRVRVFDRAARRVRELPPDACGFAYRTSVFKRGALDAIVLGVTFTLERGGAPSVRYPELASALSTKSAATPSLAAVRETVLALRRAKSMVLDATDENRRSVGSFFTNALVSRSDAEAVAARAIARGCIAREDELPRFDAGDGRVKIPAAWLIERAGFRKGERRGAFGISTRHALALVHHGGGTSRALLAFADEIRARVEAYFGVTLTLEPVVLGREAVSAG